MNDSSRFHLCVLQCGVPEGGLVPKSLYQEEMVDRSPDEPASLSPSSLYQTAHVVRDFPNEVMVLSGQFWSKVTVFSVVFSFVPR